MDGSEHQIHDKSNLQKPLIHHHGGRKALTMSRTPSRCHPIGQHAVHHQLVERHLVANGAHPFLDTIELPRCPTRAAAFSFGRHLTDLWPGGDYELAVALMVEQLPSDAVWAQGRRQSGKGKVGNVRRGCAALITVRPLTLHLPGFLGNWARRSAFSPYVSTHRWAAEWA